jgi:serine/threonine protein kinase
VSTQSSSNVEVRLPLPGHVFEKKYRIEKLLGSGGFARVYLANFEDLKRWVAIKILVPTEPAPSLYPSRLNARFLREAQLISELKNSATVTMYDFGRSENGLLYMVFEFVDGMTVEEMIRAQGPFSEARTLRIVEQVLRSLDEAHAHGILHRDIKPANIMVYDYLDDQDLVKLLDFGIAKPLMRDDDKQNLTRDNTLLGTPRYMSPEQIVNEDMGPASDIYSLGLVAFEMIMGEPALSNTDRSTLIRSHLAPQNFTLPDNLALTPGFRFILQKMVAKQISQRFSTSKDAIRAIEEWRNGTLQLAHGTQASQPRQNNAGWREDLTENPDATQRSSNSGFGGTQSTQQGGFGNQSTQHGGFGPQSTQQGGLSGSQVPSGGFGGAQSAQPSGGFGTSPAQLPQNFGGNSSAVSKPTKTKIVIEQTPTGLEVTVPPIPSPRDLVFVGLAILAFMIALSFFNFAFLLAAGVAIAYFVSRLLSESSLVLDLRTGYEVTQSVMGLDRSSRGPLTAVLRVTHSVDDDDMAALTLATHDGDRKIARNLAPDEAQWVETQVNGFLEASRGQSP